MLIQLTPTSWATSAEHDAQPRRARACVGPGTVAAIATPPATLAAVAVQVTAWAPSLSFTQSALTHYCWAERLRV